MSADDRPLIDILLPNLGADPVEVTVWFAQPGDHLYQGDRVVEVIASGATFDVPAPTTGTLTEQIVFPRDRVVSGQRLGSMRADPE